MFEAECSFETAYNWPAQNSDEFWLAESDERRGKPVLRLTEQDIKRIASRITERT